MNPEPDEPMGTHALSCAVWTTHDQPCDCGTGTFTAGVDALLAVFERHAGKRETS